MLEGKTTDDKLFSWIFTWKMPVNIFVKRQSVKFDGKKNQLYFSSKCSKTIGTFRIKKPRLKVFSLKGLWYEVKIIVCIFLHKMSMLYYLKALQYPQCMYIQFKLYYFGSPIYGCVHPLNFLWNCMLIWQFHEIYFIRNNQ